MCESKLSLELDCMTDCYQRHNGTQYDHTRNEEKNYNSPEHAIKVCCLQHEVEIITEV